SALTFRADGRGLYSSAADGSLIEWDLAGRELRRLPGPRALGPGPGFPRRPPARGPAEGLFSPGGVYLAGSERFYCLAVREVETGQDVLTLSSAARSGSSSLAFSRGGELLAVSSSLAKKVGVRLFRVESGEELSTYDTGASTPVALAFDPTGRRLAVGLGPT